MLFPILQIGVAANISSVTMCGWAALQHLSLDLPQRGISVYPKKYPIASFSAELYMLPNPAQVLCLHALGRVGAWRGAQWWSCFFFFFFMLSSWWVQWGRGSAANQTHKRSGLKITCQKREWGEKRGYF